MKNFALAATLPVIGAVPARAAQAFSDGTYSRYQLTREELPALAMMKSPQTLDTMAWTSVRHWPSTSGSRVTARTIEWRTTVSSTTLCP
ncbi:Uncharacterised protein [Corynebacterium pilosum]|uniref:Uncharacterized protein n=1 Tax=Corynebacterium pilosum TaxID=35756 RepID=A0A376CJP6_9CORY|nr:Uncharacterised protein [Corynebacterium pilosum]